MKIPHEWTCVFYTLKTEVGGGALDDRVIHSITSPFADVFNQCISSAPPLLNPVLLAVRSRGWTFPDTHENQKDRITFRGGFSMAVDLGFFYRTNPTPPQVTTDGSPKKQIREKVTVDICLKSLH